VNGLVRHPALQYGSQSRDARGLHGRPEIEIITLQPEFALTGIAVETSSADHRFRPPEIHVTGMNSALQRAPRIDASPVPLIGRAGFVPRWKPYWPKIKTFGLTFPCWPTRWGWARRCRRSRPSGCCCGAARCARVLLICPKPLVTNWQREFHAWAPGGARHGDRGRPGASGVAMAPARRARAHRQLRAAVPRPGPVRSGPSGAGGEIGPPERPAGRGQFDLVVLDEAQRIKNRQSTTSQVARAIPRRRSWALTGTPVENSAEDLVGIFEFLAPGIPFARDEAADHGPHRAATTSCAAPRTRCSPSCRRSSSATPTWN
jgi:hypothetical protein